MERPAGARCGVDHAMGRTARWPRAAGRFAFTRNAGTGSRRYRAECATHSRLRGRSLLEISYGWRSPRNRASTGDCFARRYRSREIIIDEVHVLLSVSFHRNNIEWHYLPRARMATRAEDPRSRPFR